MTKGEKLLMAFLVLLVACFVAEHILIVMDRQSPILLDPSPACHLVPALPTVKVPK